MIVYAELRRWRVRGGLPLPPLILRLEFFLLETLLLETLRLENLRLETFLLETLFREFLLRVLPLPAIYTNSTTKNGFIMPFWAQSL